MRRSAVVRRGLESATRRGPPASAAPPVEKVPECWIQHPLAGLQPAAGYHVREQPAIRCLVAHLPECLLFGSHSMSTQGHWLDPTRQAPRPCARASRVCSVCCASRFPLGRGDIVATRQWAGGGPKQKRERERERESSHHSRNLAHIMLHNGSHNHILFHALDLTPIITIPITSKAGDTLGARQRSSAAQITGQDAPTAS